MYVYGTNLRKVWGILQQLPLVIGTCAVIRCVCVVVCVCVRHRVGVCRRVGAVSSCMCVSSGVIGSNSYLVCFFKIVINNFHARDLGVDPLRVRAFCWCTRER